MSNSPVYEKVTFTIEQSQNEWITKEAEKRLLNKSIIVREGIKLLQQAYGRITRNSSEDEERE